MWRSLVRLLPAACFIAAIPASARNPEQPETSPKPAAEATFLDHPAEAPFWFGMELNSIAQAKPGMRAPYSGVNSLRAKPEAAISGLGTLFFAFQFTRTTEIILDGEMALGTGISGAVGLGGFTNLDVVRNPTLSHEPYLARVEVHQLIPLGAEWEDNDDRGPITTFARVPRHRLELRVGKMSTADLFDVNPAGSDSHLQFMNWAVDNNGAYDYAADTRGYTYGLVVEYQGPQIEARFGEMLLPTLANGLDLNWDLATSRAENLEVEIKYSRRADWAGTLRVLGFWNHAGMGSYSEANAAFLSGQDGTPDITAHRHKGNSKYGFGLNLFQEVGGNVRLFSRAGWNDGRNETFAYTEIDDTFELGADLKGSFWKRDGDRLGVAFVTNGLSSGHREYLRLGGAGFLLGDGHLRYGRELIAEGYYNVHLWRGAFVAGDLQFIGDPGYNEDRGPATVFSVRAHLEF
jgi:hypothetical protein